MISVKKEPKKEGKGVEFLVVNTSFINDNVADNAGMKWDADMWYATKEEQPYVVAKLKSHIANLLEQKGYPSYVQKQAVNMLLTRKGSLRTMSNGTSLIVNEGSLKFNSDDATYWIGVNYERYSSKDLGWLPVSRIHNHKTVPMAEQMIADNDGNIVYPCGSRDEADEKIASVSRDRVFKFREELSVIPVSKRKFEENLKKQNTWESRNVSRLKEQQEKQLSMEGR